MATHTINGQPWPSGTLVSVYPADAQPSGHEGVPMGSPVDSATVAGSSVTFAALAEGRRYVAYASGVTKLFLVQPGSVDTLRPISGSEAQELRVDLDSAELGADVIVRHGDGGVMQTDAQVLEAMLTAYAYERRVVVDAERGPLQVRPGDFTMPSGGMLAGRPGAKLEQTERVGGNVGLITVPDGVTDFVVEDLELQGLYSGSGVRTNPANSGVWTKGAVRGRISNCVAHHFDFSGFFNGVATVLDTPGDLTIENCTGHSNGVDGCEINTSAAATGASRITVTNFRTYNNRFYGLELTGDNTAGRHLTFDEIYAWENDIAGVSVDPGVGATIENVHLGRVHAYDNVGVGVSIASLRGGTFGQIIAHGNGQEGLSMSDVVGLAGSSLVLDSNDRRGLLINGACKHVTIAALTARSNGATATAGQAAVEVNSTGGACEDIQINGMDVSGNTRTGFIALGLLRGRFSGEVNSNLESGFKLDACTRVQADVLTIDNTGTGAIVAGASAGCVLELITGDTGGGTQTTGWNITTSAATDIVVHERYNNCATPRSDSGTRTQRILDVILACIRRGSGSPEGAITGSVGDLYMRTDVGTLYVKNTGAITNTGWKLVTQAA